MISLFCTFSPSPNWTSASELTVLRKSILMVTCTNSSPELHGHPSLPSGIKVIVIGCGFAGLGFAIECTRKGHEVVILDKVEIANETLGRCSRFGSYHLR